MPGYLEVWAWAVQGGAGSKSRLCTALPPWSQWPHCQATGKRSSIEQFISHYIWHVAWGWLGTVPAQRGSRGGGDWHAGCECNRMGVVDDCIEMWALELDQWQGGGMLEEGGGRSRYLRSRERPPQLGSAQQSQRQESPCGECWAWDQPPWAPSREQIRGPRGVQGWAWRVYTSSLHSAGMGNKWGRPGHIVRGPAQNEDARSFVYRVLGTSRQHRECIPPSPRSCVWRAWVTAQDAALGSWPGVYHSAPAADSFQPQPGKALCLYVFVLLLLYRHTFILLGFILFCFTGNVGFFQGFFLLIESLRQPCVVRW